MSITAKLNNFFEDSAAEITECEKNKIKNKQRLKELRLKIMASVSLVL
jgi:hypothetical protein